MFAFVTGLVILPESLLVQVMAIMKNSDYFVPPTQCNAAGVPQVRTGECVCAPLFASAFGVLNPASLQGGYLDMSAFIAEQGFKTGKGGYQKVRPTRTTDVVGSALQLSCLLHTQDYPPLYVLRPDGSTLYTYRDVVYRCAADAVAVTQAL